MKYVWETCDIKHGKWAFRFSGPAADEVIEIYCIIFDRNNGDPRTGLAAIGMDGAVFYPDDIIKILNEGGFRPFKKRDLELCPCVIEADYDR